MRLAQISIDSPSHVFTTSNSFFSVFVSRILLFAIFIAGFYFLFRIISSGYTYLTSTGEPAKIQTATKSLTNGIVGLVIVVSAYFIAQIINAVFGLNIL
jgi:hypothetical protein